MKTRLAVGRSRIEMAKAVADDIPAGSYVNLGIGLPVTIVDHWTDDQGIVVHSENGILGMRSLAVGEQPDPDIVNAAKKPVQLVTGGSYFHHADSFAIMRGGHLDYSVLGAYQVSARGDLANWSLDDPTKADAVGGAMDLAVGAKCVFVLMDHTTRDGHPRLVDSCTLPLTGVGVVSRIYTDLATVDIGPEGFTVIDMVAGLTRPELEQRTGAPLQFATAG